MPKQIPASSKIIPSKNLPKTHSKSVVGTHSKSVVGTHSKSQTKPLDNSSKKITRFGYILKKKTLTPEDLLQLKTELTIKPFKMGKYGKFAKDNSFPLYLENGDYIGIPKYYGIQKFGKPEINKLETYKYPEFDMQYLGKLRPQQEVIVKKIFDGFATQRGGLLIAGCGSGKTNMAIYIACKYKLRTLFLTHKEFLMKQAMNRIKSTTNVKEVGIIRQKKIDIEHPFVVGMIQSIAKIDYDDVIFKDFGLVIIDEVHHMGARNFSKVYQKISAKYMLGISAERQRNDRTYHIINWYMGPVIHAEEQKPNDMVVVKKYHYKTSNKERSKVIINKFIQEPDRPTMVTNLVHIKRRNRFILNLILELYDQGKNILCLTGRIKQVNLFYKFLDNNEYTTGSVGKYLGGMKQSALDESATKQIILGTYSMAEEGLDIENLNVVILCTPKSAIKQSVGRILRKEIYEEHPIVIDLIDIDNQIFKNQSKSRHTYYSKQNYHIQNFNVSDYELQGEDPQGEDPQGGDKNIMWNDSKAIVESLIKKPPKPSKQSKLSGGKRNPAKTVSYCKINVDELELLDD